MKIKHQLSVIAVIAYLVTMFASISFAATPYVDKIPHDGKPKDALVFVHWNGGNFGVSKSDDTLAFMADTVRDADIVVIVEVSTGKAGSQTVGRFCDALNQTGAKWICLISDATDKGTKSERYSVSYKPSSVEAIPQEAILSKELKGVIKREPAFVHFRVKGQASKTFTIAGFHLVPKNLHPKDEVDAVGQHSGEFQDGNMIVSGDFNLKQTKIDPVFEDQMHFQHQIEGKTSLGNEVDGKDGYFSQEFDNIYTRGVKVLSAGIIDFVPIFASLQDAKIISDHLPEFIIFVP
jgi:deoxyribonuclease-1-like protein